MTFERVELHGATITTKADISKGRCVVTVGLDAPLTSEAAAALGCREKLFTSGGEVRPDLFFSTSVFYLSAEGPFTWNSTELGRRKSTRRMPRRDERRLNSRKVVSG